MKTKILLVCLAIGIVLTFTNCGKKGCIDSNATNYCSACKKDDGSCTYQAKGVFWYNKKTADSLVANSAASLTFYVDGQVIGSSATTVYYASSPSCGQSGSASVIKNLGTSKSKSFSYSVKDDLGVTHWSGTINLSSSNSCLATELVW